MWFHSHRGHPGAYSRTTVYTVKAVWRKQREKVIKEKRRNGAQREEEEEGSLLGLIRVIIGGQSMPRQLEGVNVTKRAADGEGGGVGGGEREESGGKKDLGLPRTKGMLGNGGWLSPQK